jgi:phenylacetyl-CoA:acceptor oxidoreductase subunit 2
MKIRILESKEQKVWGWPAAVNFIFGGAAASFYILSTLIVRLNDYAHTVLNPIALHLLPPIMVGIGFFCLTVEVGRPLRGHQVFRRIFVSRMSQEALAGAIFVFTVILNWFFPHTALLICAATAAAVLLISQGAIVYNARAVIAWNVPLIPLLFVTSGFTTGAGVLLVVLGGLTSGHYTLLMALICALLNLLVWFLYLRWSHEPAFRKATETLRSLKYRILILGIGHIMPIFVLFTALIAPIGDTREVLNDIATLTMGLAMIIGSASQKAAIILKAGNQREIGVSQKESRIYLNRP